MELLRSAHCSYLLPIRRRVFCRSEAQDFAAYFETLRAAGCELITVDGSPPEVFDRHHDAWSALARHAPVDRRFGYLNDKVNGVHTGVELASHEKIILADDDVRYTSDNLQRICALLDRCEVVRPQNFLSPLPWWGCLEAARMLINRATLRIADYPGTCAFRRATILRVGHYDGDVLFDNEEIIRHFARHHAAISYATGFFIEKRPPRFRKWLEQRPRQAYEDFALRWKTALFLGLPLLAIPIGILGGGDAVAIYSLTIALLSIALATVGLKRGRASDYFPWWTCCFAPLWIFERALSTYWALSWYFTRGGYPFGDTLLSKGTGRDWVAGGRVAAQSAARQPKE